MDKKDFEPDSSSAKFIASDIPVFQKTSLQYPIILSAEGSVMDGMHRIGKAYLKGQKYIDSVQFSITPKPDYINIDPDELPYD